MLRAEAEKYIDEFEKNKEAAGYEKATKLFAKVSELLLDDLLFVLSLGVIFVPF